jgi:anthranilate phosphoribosyltransferase
MHDAAMSIAPYIKVIGRGSRGARALDASQAQDLMSQVLEGRVTDLEVGAFAVAMRIKGETPAELAGFLAATRRHCMAPTSARPQVWLPSYNGARKLPNLTALLALLLARQGVPVLVHGPLTEPARVATAEIFSALGLKPANDESSINDAWQRGEPVFVPTEALCPPLARLLRVRRVVGLRNSGHTVAKLLHPLPSVDLLNALNPLEPAQHPSAVFRVVNHTHPEYAEILSQFLAETHADAMLLRGTEGEPVADARRTPHMQVFLGGASQPALSVAGREGALIAPTDLPGSGELGATLAYIKALIQNPLGVPEPITQQVHCILRALAVCSHAPAVPPNLTAKIMA